MKQFYIHFSCICLICASAMAFDTWCKAYSYSHVRYVRTYDNGDITFFSSFYPDCYLVHLDQEGTVQWANEINLDIWAFTPCLDEGYVILYYQGDTAYLGVTDQYGEILLSEQAPIEPKKYWEELVATSDSCFIYNGYDQIIKVDADLQLVWSISTADSIHPLLSIGPALGGGDGVAAGGSGASGTDDHFQCGVVDGDGNILWANTYWVPFYSVTVSDVMEGSNGYCYQIGTCYYEPMSDGIKVLNCFIAPDPGDMKWSVSGAGLRDLCESPDGNIVAAGRTVSSGKGQDVLIRKVDVETGSTIWETTHGFEGFTADCAYSICPSVDGGYVLGGYSGENSIILRVDSLGLINGTGIASDISALSLTGPRPNPSSTSAGIEYSIEHSSEVDITITDLSGRLLATLQSGIRNPGSHSVEWDLTDANGNMVPSGVYLINVDTGEERASLRLTVIR